MSSSGGALLSLAARGPQDVFLTGNPDTSYFRQVYRRHTNFAMADVRQPIEGQIAANNISKFTLSRQGDMVSYIYIRSDQNENVLDDIDYVQLKIGGQEIVKMTGGQYGDLKKWGLIMSNSSNKYAETQNPQIQNIQPLHFWFCDYWGSSLPLCALSYHDVTVEIKWTSAPAGNTEAWANMIWLDNNEREHFVKAEKLMYLVDQWQNSDPINNDRNRMDLNFNHPVKALIVDVDQVAPYTDKIKLTTSGVEIAKMTEDQMSMKSYWHNSNVRIQALGDATTMPVIPFALDLGTNQPSGSLNFSRLENVQLSCDDNNLTGDSATLSTVTAVNTNVLIIRNGMGGLEFSN
jgi:hypothetical protein